MSYYIARVHSTFYKAENAILPTSYADDNEGEARRVAEFLNTSPHNVTTRHDDMAFVAALHKVVEAPDEKTALEMARAIPRPVMPKIYLS